MLTYNYYIYIINYTKGISQHRGLTNKVIKRKRVGEDGGEVKIHNESGGEKRLMKEKREVVIKHIEKEYIYVQNLIDILTKKYREELIKNKKS